MSIGFRLPRGFAALCTAVLAATALVPLAASPAAAASPVCLSGTLQYQYQSAEAGTNKPTLTKPVRNADVQLWGAERATDSPHQLTPDYQYTAGSDGSFNLCYTPVTTTSMSSLSVKFRTESSKLWKVTDSSGNLYTMESPTQQNVTAGRSLGVLTVAPLTAPAWHAFDTENLLWWSRNNPLSTCWSSREHDSNACTELNLQWYPTSTDGTYYAQHTNTVHLAAADPDSEHLVLHESAHFFMEHLYENATLPPLPNCAPHSIPLVSSAGCALVEGFADAAAAYLLGDYRFVWPNGSSRSFTYGSGWQTGDQVQGNVDGSLLDLWNHTDGGWNKSIDVLVTHSPVDFAAYFNNRLGIGLPETETVLTYLAAHTINYLSSPVNDGRYHMLTNGNGMAMDRDCAVTGDPVVDLGAPSATHSPDTWKVELNADHTVRVYDSCSTPLTLTAPTSAGGPATLQFWSPASQYQKWHVTPNSSGTYTFTNLATGFVLDTSGTAAGTAVTVNPAGSANTQDWADWADS
ncbi:RICIN domain-containing protein [Kitasatospora sp. NPDC059827]|uniref:RICIN domain-containing protein n=1 Tax=Kitasatospora sp. NPDC059827 TaxID=3346964 RepID=UPI00366629F7